MEFTSMKALDEYNTMVSLEMGFEFRKGSKKIISTPPQGDFRGWVCYKSMLCYINVKK